MLQKSKHIVSVFLTILFLFPIVYQSVHVFGHGHDSDCCSSCGVINLSIPASEDAALLVNPEDIPQECQICSFHYPKLQFQSDLRFAPLSEVYTERYDKGRPKPFVLYAGFDKSLRAPPA